jgi:hypothetical protein
LIQPLNPDIERTEVIHGSESVIGIELHFFPEAKARIDTCMDSTRPALAIGIEPIRKSFAEAKRNGVHLRYLTEITNDLRHLLVRLSYLCNAACKYYARDHSLFPFISH